MTSYDIGYLLGHIQAIKWIAKRKDIDKIDIRHIAKEQYTGCEMCFKALHTDDFRDGFIDGLQAALKSEKIELEG